MKFKSNRADYYRIDIHENFCSVLFPDSCTLYVAFCKELPSGLCNNDSLGPTSACITNGTTGYSLGEYSENPFEPSEFYLRLTFLCDGDFLMNL